MNTNQLQLVNASLRLQALSKAVRTFRDIETYLQRESAPDIQGSRTTKKGKPLKAQYIRKEPDRTTYGYYGLPGSGGELKEIKTPPLKGKKKKEKPTAGKDKAVDFGGEKVKHWRSDSAKILGGANKKTLSDEPGEKGKAPKAEGSETEEIKTTKTETGIANVLARLAEAEAQYLKVKKGMDYSTAYKKSMSKVRDSFKKIVLDKIQSSTGHEVVFNSGSKSFMYAKAVEGKHTLSARDKAIADRVTKIFLETARRLIKARTTAVRRAKGSDE